MGADPNVHVPVITGIPTNLTDVATLAILAGTTNLATTTGHVDPTIPVGLNNRPMSCREDPPLAPPNEGRTHVEQPPGTTTGFGPRFLKNQDKPSTMRRRTSLGMGGNTQDNNLRSESSEFRYLDPPHSNIWCDLPSVNTQATPANQGRTGDETLFSIGLANHEKLPIIGLAGQRESPFLGVADPILAHSGL
uniref:Uncharacterized protein n=1 Tax=Cannabis sativa TaxID=3483 RepID=A0A803PJQ4_CANSA